jgi:hypothetical protein
MQTRRLLLDKDSIKVNANGFLFRWVPAGVHVEGYTSIGLNGVAVAWTVALYAGQ